MGPTAIPRSSTMNAFLTFIYGISHKPTFKKRTAFVVRPNNIGQVEQIIGLKNSVKPPTTCNQVRGILLGGRLAGLTTARVVAGVFSFLLIGWFWNMKFLFMSRSVPANLGPVSIVKSMGKHLVCYIERKHMLIVYGSARPPQERHYTAQMTNFR
jgi:hypothetical protein